MQKNMTQIKAMINGKEHFYMCEMECSTIEVKEALYQFTKYVGQIEDAHATKLKAEQDSKIEILEDQDIDQQKVLDGNQQ